MYWKKMLDYQANHSYHGSFSLNNEKIDVWVGPLDEKQKYIIMIHSNDEEGGTTMELQYGHLFSSEKATTAYRMVIESDPRYMEDHLRRMKYEQKKAID